MIAMSVAAQHDLDILKLETQLLNGVLNRGGVALKNRIDQDMPLRCRDQKRRQAFSPNVVHVPDDFMRWKLLVLLFRAAHVTGEEILNRKGARRLLSSRNSRNGQNRNRNKSLLHMPSLWPWAIVWRGRSCFEGA